MTVLFPTTLGEAISALADPEAQVLAGGTDFMVEVNAGRRRPTTVVSLRRIPALHRWHHLPDGAGSGTRAEVRLGATVTYADMLQPPLAGLLPALAQAARTIGSPQIRNAGTLGGNLGTASPAGDTLPVLAALDAVVEVAGAMGKRDVAVAEFVTGPKRNALEPGELVVAVRVPILEGHQEFRKVGVRNAMVIAVASLALALDARTRTVRCALGSVGPVPIRASAAEAWLAAAIDWHRLATTPPDAPATPATTGDPPAMSGGPAPGSPATTGGPPAMSGGPAPGSPAATGGPAPASPATAPASPATAPPGGPALARRADLATFARLVGEAARPIDDHRGTAAYRRHAVTVLAARAAAAARGAVGAAGGAAP